MHGFMLMAEQCGCQRLSKCVSKCITRLRQRTGALFFFLASVKTLDLVRVQGLKLLICH